MSAPLRVAGRVIGPGETTYVIADAACEHGGDVQLGYKLIETAGAAGADAVVFDAPGHAAALSPRDFKSLLGHAQYVGMTAFGRASDDVGWRHLEDLDLPAHALIWQPERAELLEAMRRSGRPIFVSIAADAPEWNDGPGTVVLRDGSSGAATADGSVVLLPHRLSETARLRNAIGAIRMRPQVGPRGEK